MRPMFMLRRHSRVIAVFLLVEFLLEMGAPMTASALTSGPNQPEFASFEPVATTNMVNEFSGDFTYNLPLLEVPGPHGSSYPLSLSYHSGVNQEEEASWVGFGWTLNPGAINRNTRGFPDDYKGKTVKRFNKQPKNWTATAGFAIAPEIFGKDMPEIKLNLSASLRYNNYRGFGYNIGLGAAFGLGKGTMSLGYSLAENGSTKPSFSLQISPAKILGENKNKADVFPLAAETFKPGKRMLGRTIKKIKEERTSLTLLTTGEHGLHTFNDKSFPTTATAYSGLSTNFSIGLNATVPAVPVGVSPNIFGSYTYQTNIPEVSSPSFGYMYSANATTTGVMDYQIEKESDYNKRDVFLGIPFNTADNFMVTAEGLGGGFRLQQKNLGHFGPTTVNSSIKVINIGAELNLGVLLAGGGIDAGVGSQSLKLQDWRRDLSSFMDPASAGSTEDEPVFFRFNNDLGGEWGTVYDDKPIDPKFSGTDPFVPASLLSPNGGVRSGRSSYIGYHTNADMAAHPYKAYSRNSWVNQVSARTDPANADLIGEMTVYNEQGLRYNYALPVYNRNERQLSYGIIGASPGDIDNRHLAYFDNGKTLIGEEKTEPYAGTYLLTEINSPDYVDRRLDGPTPDDFGGYTRFNYENPLPNGWFKWRIPYHGLHYNRNSQSDPMDDLGNKEEGERNIYMLRSIETKSHVAIFYCSNRSDGYEAPVTDRAPNDAKRFARTPVAGPGRLQRLDSISVFPIDVVLDVNRMVTRNSSGQIVVPGDAKAIKTVYFDYGDSLCVGAPNASNGKLTLKRVYFQYNGIKRTRISPYEFKYEYPAFSSYPAKYQNGATDDVTGVYDNMPSTVQNPIYNAFNMDPWGNYQANGATRHSNLENWIDQTAVMSSGFDPAAWSLKVIKLPSGGEIHVQYEQDDYQYVQDQRAHVMARLYESSNSSDSRFYIDMSSILPNAPAASLRSLTDATLAMIQERYVGTTNKIYFKFLYSLLGAATPDLQTCNADFVTGYATVVGAGKGVGVDSARLYVDLRSDATNKLPVAVCREFVKANRIGKLDQSANCDPNNGLSDGTNAAALIKGLLNMAQGAINPNSLCQKMNFSLSYLRIPTPLPKKGGGLRVKRLLMFDAGLEGNPSLFGNEYLYTTKDSRGNIISSGVSTNEPGTIREECILTDFIARDKQGWFDRLIAGDDMKQSEGPIGESILPAASVGYSKVTMRNIHSGKTNPGFTVNEFYTAKDYPVMVKMSDIRSQTEHLYRPAVLVNITKDKTRAMQGFSFVLNDMHGQVKRQATYSGSYSDVLDLNKSILVSDQQYEYFEPGQKIPVQNKLFGAPVLRNPGREVDVTFAQKRVSEINSDANVEVDFSVGFIPLLFIVIPIPYATAVPSLMQFEGDIYTHTSSKVVRYPSLLKKTRVYQDGIIHTTEYQAFDEMTGRPVATKESDDIQGAYLAQEVPAGWEYAALGNKANSEGKLIKASSLSGSSLYINFDYKTTTDASIQFAGEKSCVGTSEFVVGDMLDLGGQQLYHVTQVNYASDQIDLVRSMESAGGVLPDGTLPQLVILRSGKGNELKLAAGQITFHNETEANLSAASQAVPDAGRYITSGTDPNDGSLFIKHLNDAFINPALLPLAGPYYHMNMAQYTDKLPVGCLADLSNATIKNVNVQFKTVGGQVTIEMGSFDLQCGTQWVTISN